MRYPNIELAELLFENELSNRFQFEYGYELKENDYYVFPQVWANTGGGFSRKGYCYGQALTKQYTTVGINHKKDAAIVLFDNKPAYFIHPLTEKFWEDVRNCDMASVENMHIYNEETGDKND